MRFLGYGTACWDLPPPFGTQTLALSVNDRGHRVTATRTARDPTSGAEEMDGLGPPSEAAGCIKSLCKSPPPHP